MPRKFLPSAEGAFDVDRRAGRTPLAAGSATQGTPPTGADCRRPLVGGIRLVRLDPAHAYHRTAQSPECNSTWAESPKATPWTRPSPCCGKAAFPRRLVDAGGDLGLGDPPPGRPGWRIGLTPLDDKKPVKYLVLSRAAVSTSGDNVQYVEIGGRRYSHVVDPRTGMALTDHCRVTIVMPNGMAADALCKVVAVLGPERGLKVIETTPDAAALILRAPQGKIEQFQSSRWKDLPTISAEPQDGK